MESAFRVPCGAVQRMRHLSAIGHRIPLASLSDQGSATYGPCVRSARGPRENMCEVAGTLVRHLHYEILSIAKVLYRREVLTGAEVRAALHDAYPPIKEVHPRGPESVAALPDRSDNTPSGPPPHPTAAAADGMSSSGQSDGVSGT